MGKNIIIIASNARVVSDPFNFITLIIPTIVFKVFRLNPSGLMHRNFQNDYVVAIHELPLHLLKSAESLIICLLTYSLYYRGET